MKSVPLPTTPSDAPDTQVPGTGRRRLVLGASVAAGAAVAAATLHRKPEPRPLADSDDRGAGSPEGYRLTEHIRRYYETTRS